MTPISASDRPKIITLGVLSVIMFGYFAKTLLGAVGDHAAAATPPSPPVTPAPAATAPVPTVAAVATTPAPSALAASTSSLPVIESGGPAEPFRKVLPEPGQTHNPPPAVKQSIRGNASGGLPVPAMSGSVSPMPVMGGSVVAGPSLAKVEPAIRLDGVVTDSENCAVVSYGDKSDIIRAGRKVAGVYKLISVDESGASFRGPSGVFRLEVGQQHTAPAILPSAAPQPSSTSSAPAMADTSGMLPLPTGR